MTEALYDFSLPRVLEDCRDFEEFGPFRCWVYFAGQHGMGDGELVKIGRSRNPVKRMKQLANQHGFHPRVFGMIPGTSYHETSIHDLFSYRRKEGEWFFADERMRHFVENFATHTTPEVDRYNARISHFQKQRRLTDSDVKSIRIQYARGGIFLREIADEYGTSISTIAHAIRGRTFAHITDPPPMPQDKRRRAA